MMIRKVLIPFVVAYALISMACVYIVLPAGLEVQEAAGKESGGWGAMVTNIGESTAGDLHIDLTIQNDTGDWSAMETSDDEPVVISSGGKDTTCSTTFVSTGGHRLAPGFRVRGYTAGTKAEPETQQIYVECEGVEAAPGATLTIPYRYFTGQYNYYEQDKNLVEDRMDINLDEVATDPAYPIGEQVEGLIQNPDIEIIALNKVVLKLLDVQRTESGLQFTWNTTNSGEYPSYVHIGTPPVIGEDGILYGYYETPDIVSVPITPAGAEAEWTTDVQVPAEVDNFYIMLSVETGKARLFTNYAIDITGE